MPSLCLLIGLSWLYMAHGDVPVIAGVFYGIRPAVKALVVQAAWRIGGRTLKHRWLWGIAVAAFGAIFALQVPFPAIVLLAACAGHGGGRVSPQVFSAVGAHGSAAASAGGR